MSASRRMAEMIRSRLLGGDSADERRHVLAPRPPETDPLPPRIPAGNEHSQAGVEKRRAMLRARGIVLDHLDGSGPPPDPADLAGNIENLIGYAQVPVGVIGPLRVNGACARGDFYVPMATSEGALVASYNRGAYLVSQSGGAAAVCFTESVARSPCFIFGSMQEACVFLDFVLAQADRLQQDVDTTSHHCRLVDLRPSLVGKEVYISFEYQTGDAAGQNMVTLATDAVCRGLIEKAPVKPEHWFVEGNFSGDKKATMLSFLTARGKKVIAEVAVPGRLLERIVHASPADMVRYWEIAFMGGAQSGSIGVQGHFANALAALFVACGQDAACVSEASTGITRMDVTGRGELYVAVTLPNLIVGTVGGGTRLPTARECLEMMGCYGTDGARKFAEICAATVLAGEISIIGALAAGEFAAAHARYGRRHDRKRTDASPPP